MRILHVITCLPRNAGPSVFCVELCNQLQARGVDTAILVRVPPRPGDYLPDSGVALVPMSRPWPWRPDVVHVHGLWSWNLHVAARACRRADVPYVISPHGMLAPWALGFKRWRKRLAWHVFQRADLQHAARLHATAEPERRDLLALSLHPPVIVAPLGVRACDGAPPHAGGNKRCRRVLFLGRIHPVKGLENLVAAWAQCGHGGADRWQLVIAGPDGDGYGAAVAARARSHGLTVCWGTVGDAGGDADAADVLFVGPVQGVAKAALHREADLFVLPSFTENFGMVVLDALAEGLPVIATRGTPWAVLEKEGDGGGRCGWWIEIGVAPLAQALHAAMSLTDDQRRALGANGRRLVAARYRWDAIADTMQRAYAAILDAPGNRTQGSGGAGSLPDCQMQRDVTR
jgi:glycosyltransferase involved in cell wall biosynthesis